MASTRRRDERIIHIQLDATLSIGDPLQLAPGGRHAMSLETIWEEQRDDVVSEPFDIAGAQVLEVLVDDLRDGYISCEIERPGETPQPLTLVREATGHTAGFVSEPGLYRALVAGASRVRFHLEAADRAVNAATLRIDRLATGGLPLLKPLATPRAPLPRILSRVNGPIVCRDLAIDGTCYGTDGTGLFRSSTFAAAWTEIVRLPLVTGDFVAQVKKLPSGPLLATTQQGQVWLSNADGQGFATRDLPPGPKGFTHAFGLAAHGSLVALSEYSPLPVSPPPANAIHAWLSEDAGQSWRQFFPGPNGPFGLETGLYHNHDVAYDPYEDLFWLCSGDGFDTRMIFYTGDRGEHWFRACPFGKAPMQSTQILPLPDCVLFVSDSRRVGVTRYDRVLAGVPRRHDALTFDTAFILSRSWKGNAEGTGEVPIATRGISTPATSPHGAAAYLAWYLIPDARSGPDVDLRTAPVYATRDGRTFHRVYDNQVEAVGTGVSGLYGPDRNGNLVIALDDASQGPQPWTCLRLNHDMWRTT